jgi:hypothetical protein
MTVLAQSGTQHDRIIVRGPIRNDQIIVITGATPSVGLGNVFKTNNGSPVTITDFPGGGTSQQIWIVCGDSNTTIANSGTITTSGAGNQQCSLGTVFSFIYDAGQTKWLQTATGGGSGGGGGGSGGTGVYSTPAIGQIASISPILMTTAPVADQQYMFTAFVDQQTAGTSCTTPGSVYVNLIFTDAATNQSYTQVMQIQSASTLGSSVPLSSGAITLANTGSGYYQFTAKASTTVQYSTTYASGSCSAGQAYNIYPFLSTGNGGGGGGGGGGGSFTLPGTVVQTNQSNNYSSGLQNFGSVSLVLPIGASISDCVNRITFVGSLCVDTVTDDLLIGPATTLASDNFNRSNVNPIDSPWVSVGGFNGRILSNQFVGSTAGANGVSAYDGSISWPHDQFAQAQLIALTPGKGFAGFRLDVSGSGSYQCGIDTGATPGGIGQPFSSFIIFRNGAELNGAGNGRLHVGTIAPGDTFKVQIIGQTITVYQNGLSLGSVTDPGSAMPAGKPGLEASPYNGGAITDVIWDNFSAGTSTTSGVAQIAGFASPGAFGSAGNCVKIAGLTGTGILADAGAPCGGATGANGSVPFNNSGVAGATNLLWAPSTGSFSFNGGTLTTDINPFNLNFTLNNVSQVFNGVKWSATNSAYAAGSFDYQFCGDSHCMTIDPAGNLNVPKTLASGDSTVAGNIEFQQGPIPGILANNVGFAAPTSVPSGGHVIILPASPCTGNLTLTAAGQYSTMACNGVSSISKRETAKTVAVTSTQLCAVANCGAGEYVVNVHGNSTAVCATPGPAAISFSVNFTTDTIGAMASVPIQIDTWNGSGAARATSMPLGDTATIGGGEVRFWSTGAADIQLNVGYTACTSGTGTYSYSAEVQRLQ